jgi:hypothetical protein
MLTLGRTMFFLDDMKECSFGTSIRDFIVQTRKYTHEKKTLEIIATNVINTAKLYSTN